MLNCDQCDTVRILLNCGANPDARDDFGQTPFQVALQNKNFGVMRELVRGGADINLPINEKQETYLHLAILKCELPGLIKFLLDLGADVNKKDIYGLTPAQKAALTGDAFLLEVLAKNGADMSVRDSNGWSLLHCAARYGHNDAVTWLLANQVDLEAKSNIGRTALHFAAQHGQAGVVDILLDGGAKVSPKDDTGWTALRWANYRGHKSVVQRILDKSGGFNDTKISTQSVEAVNLLLSLGADPDVRDDFGRTPFLFAMKKNNLKIMWELVNGGADINLPVTIGEETYLHLAILKDGSPSLVQFLVDIGADVNKSDIFGLTPIQKAVLMGNIIMLDLLAENGAVLTVRDSNGWSLLHCAACYGHDKVAMWLVGKEADLDAECDSGRTPLHFAAKHGQAAVAQILLDHGACALRVDNKGWTALRWAEFRGHKAIIDQILAREETY